MLKFNYFVSFYFWGAFLLIALLTRSLIPGTNARKWGLFLTSAVMLLAIPRFALVHFGLLLLAIGFSFFIGSALRKRAALGIINAGKTILAVGICVIVAFLAFFKYHPLQTLLFGNRLSAERQGPSFAFLIGVSYFSFKMIHYLVESYRNKIENVSILNYVNYIVFFPSFISGPINRYNPFSAQISDSAKRSLGTDLKIGAERILHGLFKKLVIVHLLAPHILGNPAKPISQLSLGGVVLGLYAYALYFYFDFSGYSDLAIGSARILGFELPENFNNPFFKRNIRELWTNWHISLTGWLVDYIYWPLVRMMRGVSYFRNHPVSLSNIGMIITFIICGMWHGEAINFIIWGAYHGLGISALTIYQREKRKKMISPAARKYFHSRLSTVIGPVLTFNFFALGLAFFVLDWEGLKVVFSAIWP